MISKSKINNSQAGFTLVELLVTTVIMSIVGLAISEALVVWGNSTRDNNDKQNIHRELQIAIDQINKALTEATDCKMSSYNGGYYNEITIDQLGGGTVVFHSDPSTGALERDGVNILNNGFVNTDIEVDNLRFTTGGTFGTGTATDKKKVIRTTLSLRYQEASGIDYVVRISSVTTLRNS